MKTRIPIFYLLNSEANGQHPMTNFLKLQKYGTRIQNHKTNQFQGFWLPKNILKSITKIKENKNRFQYSYFQ